MHVHSSPPTHVGPALHAGAAVPGAGQLLQRGGPGEKQTKDRRAATQGGATEVGVGS